VSICVVVYGWERMYGMVDKGSDGIHVVPANMWQMAVATSGAALMILAAATLVFKVAEVTFRRAHRHAVDADTTRRVELMTRMMTTIPWFSEENRMVIVGKILETAKGTAAESNVELSAIPEIFERMAAMLSSVMKSAKSASPPE
jgi:hypothetical protein